MKLLKSLFAAAAIATAATGALADPVFSIILNDQSAIGDYAAIDYDPLPGAEFGPTFIKAGTLWISEAGQVTFSFVSSSATYNNSFETFYVGGTKIWSSDNASKTFTVNVEAGALNFAYLSQGVGTPVGNGAVGMGVDLHDTNKASALIVFNDSATIDGDYDDLTISAVAAVPEAETYAMLLAGLGLMGTIARRRNKAKAA